MKQTNLYCTVGRGPRQCIGTLTGSEDDVRIAADALQAVQVGKHQAAGIDSSRVKFEREVVGGAAAKAKKEPK